MSPPFMIPETLMYVVSAITTRLFIGLVKYYMVVLSGDRSVFNHLYIFIISFVS